MPEGKNFNYREVAKFLLKRDTLKTFSKKHSLQWLVASAMREQGITTLNLNRYKEPLILSYKGLSFYASEYCFYMYSVYEDYPMDKIREGDIVVDIGANIGCFSLPASKVARKVYAIEPLFADELTRNIELNRVKNIGVLECGVGQGSERILELWKGDSQTLQTNHL